METEKEIIELRAQLKMLEAKVQALQDMLAREGIVNEEELQDEMNRITKHDEHKK